MLRFTCDERKIWSVIKKSQNIMNMIEDNTRTFQELLKKGNSVSTHHKNLQVLAMEMFKTYRDLSPEILRKTFVSKTSLHNLHKNDAYERCQLHSDHSSKSIWLLGSKILYLVPVELKQSESLDSFKLKIKNWTPFECSYRLCKSYYNK